MTTKHFSVDPFENDEEVGYSIARAEHHIKESIRDNLSRDQLLNIETKLSGYYSYLQVQAAIYLGDMNDDYWNRSIEYSRGAIKERATKMAQNKLDHLAKTEVSALIRKQNMSALQAEYLKRFCMGINRVIESVKSRLRWMEIEYKHQRNQT